LVGLDLEVTAARIHLGAASVEDARAVATVLRVRDTRSAEGGRESGENYSSAHGGILRSLLEETLRSILAESFRGRRKCYGIM